METPDTESFDIEIRDIKTGHVIQKGLQNPTQKRTFLQMPLSRWFLLASSVITLSLPFLPWMVVHDFAHSVDQPISIVPTSILFSFLMKNLAFNLQSSFYAAFVIALVMATVSPGILFSIWIHNSIRTRPQQLGVLLFTLWIIVYIASSIYLIVEEPARIIGQFQFYIHNNSISITYDRGFYLFCLVSLGYIVGLALVWWEMIHTPISKNQITVRKQSLIGYIGAGTITAGIVIWFLFFYGYYWMLPTDCLSTGPVFSTIACWPREDTFYGFLQLFELNMIWQSSFLIYALFYGTGVVIMLGGAAINITSWLRNIASINRIWIFTWSMLLGGITTASAYGMYEFSKIYTMDNWTSAFPFTLLGIGLIAIGFVIQYLQGNKIVIANNSVKEILSPEDTLKRL